MKNYFTLFLFLVAFSFSVMSHAAIRYVKPAATGNADGSSWSNASADFQVMINASNAGDQVWVAEGSYWPTSGNDRTIAFSMKNDVAIYGGFIGTETNLNQRNWQMHISKLTGAIGSTASLIDNSYHVMANVYLNSSAILDGFTIEAGYAEDPTNNNGNGAGMINYYASPTLNHINFIDNHAVHGGGLYNFQSSPQLNQCIFSIGSGVDGGALFNSYSNPQLYNVLFSNNSANNGGAMYNSFSNPTMINNTFFANVAINGGTSGAIFNTDASTPVVINTLFAGNIVNGSGAVVTADIGDYNGSNTQVSYSCLQLQNVLNVNYLSGTSNGVGNIFAQNPLLLGTTNPQGADGVWATADDGLQVSAASPIVNAGNNASLPSTITEDLTGLTRIKVGVVDMGAYEQPCVSSQTVNIGICAGSSYYWSVTNTNYSQTGVYSVTDICGNIATLNLSVFNSGIVYVNANASGANNGTSWNDAYTNVQTALGFANVCPLQIWVAQGTYFPTASLSMKNDVAIYGGFVGNETSLNERDWKNNVTIINGSASGGQTIFKNTNVTNTAILDGFTITAGYAIRCGGMMNTNSNPTIRNCLFSNNVGNGEQGSHGINGIENRPNGADGINGVDGVNGINGLPGANGGNGGFCQDGVRGGDGTNATDGTNGTDATDGGNGIHADIPVVGGSGGDGGLGVGAMYNNNSNPSIINCIFNNNTGHGGNGGQAGQYGHGSNGGNGGDGIGGIFNKTSNVNLTNCVFTNNKGYGGNAGDGGSGANGSHGGLGGRGGNGGNGGNGGAGGNGGSTYGCFVIYSHGGNGGNAGYSGNGGNGGHNGNGGNGGNAGNGGNGGNGGKGVGALMDSASSVTLNSCDIYKNEGWLGYPGYGKFAGTFGFGGFTTFGGGIGGNRGFANGGNGGGVVSGISGSNGFHGAFSQGYYGNDSPGPIPGTNGVLGVNGVNGNYGIKSNSFYNVNSTVSVNNSIVWSDSYLANIINNSSSVTVNSSIWQGGYAGTNNSGSIPYFVNANNPIGADNKWFTLDDGLQLQTTSPALNSGDNSAIPSGILTDVTGLPRIINGNVDRGAYEEQHSNFNLKLFIQGYYNGAASMQSTLLNEGIGNSATNTDSINIELHKSTSPFDLVSSSSTMLHTDGTATANFISIPANSYYIVIKHRNSVETWSANPIAILPVTNYDFTTAANKAYGENQIEVEPGIFAFYTGDINQDESIDASDEVDIDNGSNNSAYGYETADLNGDGSIDGSDYPIWDANASNSIYSIHP